MSDLIDAEGSGAGGVTRAEGEAGEEGPPVAADAQLEDHSPGPVWIGYVDLDAAWQAGAVSGLGVAALELVGRELLGGELVAFSLCERPSGVRRGVLEILGERGVVELDAEVRAGPGSAGHLPLAVSRQERAVLGLEGGKLLCRHGTSVVLGHDRRIGVGH